ncbi:O-antigen ligase family protein [Candidatus Shapirobacteria bacterium]|nr:O-antigen ligase family protein [Candidatus Shapirobacteria bacterium]
MLGWLLICSLVNGNPNSFFGQYYRYQGLITMVGYLGWYWLVAKLNRNKILEKLGTIMTVGASLVTLLIFFQKFAGADGRVAGFLGNPNFAGGYLALTSPFINNWWLLGIIGGGIWLTGSRSALIAFGMIIAVKLWQRVLNRRLLVLAGVFCLISGILIYPKREVSSFDQRGVIWQRGIEAIAKKPVFGWGVENFEVAFGSTLKQNDFDLKNIRVDKAHNEWLEMGVAGGVPAMVIYAWLCAEALLRLYRARQVNALLCLVGFLFISAVNVVNINEYLFFYLAVGISSLSTQRDTTGRARASRAPTLR